MKVILLVALLMTVSFANSVTFWSAINQSLFGWAVNYDHCKSKLHNYYNMYTHFYGSFIQMDPNYSISFGTQVVNEVMQSPRCYYGTSIATNIMSILMFDFIDIVTGHDMILKASYYAYEVVVYYGSMVFDVWALYLDVMSVFQGTYNNGTIGYILGFFVRNAFNPTM